MGKSTEKRALLDMGEAALNAGRWDQAQSLYERVLELDPGSSRGYVGRLLSRMRVRTQEELIRLAPDFPEDEDFNMALLYSDGEQRDSLMDLCRRAFAVRDRAAVSLDSILGTGSTDAGSDAAEPAPVPEIDLYRLLSEPLSVEDDLAESGLPSFFPHMQPEAPAVQPTAAPAAQPAAPAAEPAETDSLLIRQTPLFSTSFFEDLEAAAAEFGGDSSTEEPFYITNLFAETSSGASASEEPEVPPDAFPGIPAPTGTPVSRPATRPRSRSDIRALENSIRSQTGAVNNVLDEISCERSFGLSTLPLCLLAAGLAWGAMWYYKAPQQLTLMVTVGVFAFTLLVNLLVSLLVSRNRMRRMAEELFPPEVDRLEELYEELYSARAGRPLCYTATLMELRQDVQRGRYNVLLPDCILYEDEMI